MNTPRTITFTKKEGGFTTSSNTRREIMECLEKRNEANFELITPKKARSNKANRYYWSVVLRLIGEHVDMFSDYVVQDDKTGRFDYTVLHRALTIRFAVDNNRPDLCDYVETILNGDWVKVPIVSYSFSKMPPEDAAAYMNWLEKQFVKITGKTFDEMLKAESMEVG